MMPPGNQGPDESLSPTLASKREPLGARVRNRRADRVLIDSSRRGGLLWWSAAPTFVVSGLGYLPDLSPGLLITFRTSG